MTSKQFIVSSAVVDMLIIAFNDLPAAMAAQEIIDTDEFVKYVHEHLPKTIAEADAASCVAALIDTSIVANSDCFDNFVQSKYLTTFIEDVKLLKRKHVIIDKDNCIALSKLYGRYAILVKYAESSDNNEFIIKAAGEENSHTVNAHTSAIVIDAIVKTPAEVQMFASKPMLVTYTQIAANNDNIAQQPT